MVKYPKKFRESESLVSLINLVLLIGKVSQFFLEISDTNWTVKQSWRPGPYERKLAHNLKWYILEVMLTSVFMAIINKLY